MFSFLKKIGEKIVFIWTKFKKVFSSERFKKFFLFLPWKKQAALNHDQVLVANLAPRRVPHWRQLKYLPQLFSRQEWLTVKIFFMVFCLALLALLVDGFFLLTKVAPATGSSYTEGLVGTPKLINPLYASLNDVDQDLASLVYAGLVRVNAARQIVPDLAESWTVSSNQREYTFVLRKNLKWHDGEKVTADDVVFTIETLRDPEFKSPLAANFSGVKVEAIDEQIVKFILPNSYTPFLENLRLGLLPAHLWQEVVPANALLVDYNLKPIGAGPYKFESLIKDKLGNIKVYTLERHKDYLPQAPYLKEISFKFFPDFEAAATALKNHQVEGISYLPAVLNELVGERHDLKFNLLGLPQYIALFFNQKTNTAMADLKVRQALAYALDKKEILAVALGANGEIIDTPILSGMVGFSPNVAKYEFNVTKAQELLESAGWKLLGETRKKNNVELKIVLTTVNRAENYKAAQVIQKMWRALGLRVDLQIMEAGQIQNEIIRDRNFEVLLFGELLGLDPDLYPFWHSSQSGGTGLNITGFSHKEADLLLEETRQITDLKQRHDKYVKFQEILAAQLPAIFLFTPKYIYPLPDKIKGFTAALISLPSDRFDGIMDWYVKTKRVLK
jgi:peptide/nickel transport system substrate-binding protein